MTSDPLVVLRCSTIIYRNDSVLLIKREGRGDWVLPGGQPRSHEGILSCARREIFEETGLSVDPGRCAFVFETMDPTGEDRVIEIVFLTSDRSLPDPPVSEPGMKSGFVPLNLIGPLNLRPPLAGHIRALHGKAAPATAPYLGNLWRPANNVRSKE